MIAEGSPTLRRRKLAAELRRLREDAGLNGVQVSKALRWSTSKISRMENGQVAPSARDVARLLKHYEIEGDLAASLLGLVQPDSAKGWWDSYADVLGETVLELIGLEAGATRIRTWHAVMIPGLLQTRAYADQIGYNYQSMEIISPRKVERRTDVRMRRQRRIAGENPLVFEAVLDESVLRRRFGRSDSELMTQQLRQLVKLSELPNVSIQILKLDQSHPTDVNNFIVLSFPSVPVLGPLSSDVVYSENYPHYTLTEDPENAYQYSVVFDLLTEAALDVDASRDYMASLAGM
ncbi:helix-turn-helix domain-containing protein [Nonomuraea sediminis]|uniref:helix-turn-helix domain-containing protein n=1 Tax=Nonomuraea sediminis TaxID=2835864 RepID=UPI001BDD5605|nr:helix-turn-helix transcriptional regulator [Nonomuraea sediminis]